MHSLHRRKLLSKFLHELLVLKVSEIMDRWVNKIALVTGAGAGIGRAVAELLVNHGMRVVGIDCRVDKLKLLADEWKSKPGKLIPLQCDLANEAEIVRSVQWIEKNLGVVEILINDAAVQLPTLLVEGNIEEWRRTLDVNVLGVVILTREVLKLQKKKGLNSGVIVNINDIGAWTSVSGMNRILAGRGSSTAYLCSKNALLGLTENLRVELALMQSNVRVVSIVPGLVDTEGTEQILREKPRLVLKPMDVAEAVIFAIQTPDSILIQDLVITPVGDIVA